MYNLLVISYYVFAFLIYLCLVIITINYFKMTKFKKQKKKELEEQFKIDIPTSEIITAYQHVTLKTNIFVTICLIFVIISGRLLIRDHLYLSVFFCFFVLIFLILSGQKWKYFIETVSKGYIILDVKKFDIYYYRFKSNKEEQYVLSLYKKMFYQLYLIVLFFLLSLVSYFLSGLL